MGSVVVSTNNFTPALINTDGSGNKTLVASDGSTPAISGLFTTTKTNGYTVATLPAGSAGMRAYVTDAVTPTWNGALTGGGTVVVPVMHNGTAWVSV